MSSQRNYTAASDKNTVDTYSRTEFFLKTHPMQLLITSLDRYRPHFLLGLTN